VYAYATTDGNAGDETEVGKTEGVYKTTVTADTTIAVTFKEVQQPVTHIYIPLLSGFDDVIQIEKTNATSDTATLTVSLKDGVSAEVPALTAYIAVYSGGVLKEVITEVFDSETGVVNITKPTGLEGTDSYKIFIWTDKYEPVTEPITAEFFE
ncbi:MAG: hypothetical protein IJG06_00445, partial [Clostridia bacterium]|nr:hypothetical protein [Clostridia bacterium]